MTDSSRLNLAGEILDLEPRLDLDALLEASTLDDATAGLPATGPVSVLAAQTDPVISNPRDGPTIAVTDPEDVALDELSPDDPPASDAPQPQTPIPVTPPTPVEQAPSADEPANLVVVENAAAQTAIAELPLLFPEDFGAVRFDLAENPGGLFEIFEDTLRVAPDADIDFESAQSHSVSVSVTTETGTTVQDFTIAVQNVIEIDTVDVVRLFNSRNGSHHFTASDSELADIGSTLSSFSVEMVSFRAIDVSEIEDQAAEGAIPVFRLYDTKKGTHFFTTSETERDTLLESSQYIDEGVGFGAYSGDDFDSRLDAVFRLFNTNTGKHLWTMSSEEVDVLDGSQGWRSEGIAFYAFRVGEAPAASASNALPEVVDLVLPFPGFDLSDLDFDLPGEILIA